MVSGFNSERSSGWQNPGALLAWGFRATVPSQSR